MNMLETIIETCHSTVWTDPEVYPYIKNRGISDETIRDWKLGSFPENINLLYQLYVSISADKDSIKILKRSGSELESPFLRNRLIIPVNTAYGAPEAVIGRATISSEEVEKYGFPKYYNTYYKKSRSLFGLDKAIPYILSSNTIIIAEGNLDVIQAHQAGLRNVVAASSASLSRHQLMLAARYASEIFLAFDNDETGQAAILTTMKKHEALAKKLGVTISPLCFSGGKDLDELIANGGIPW